MGVLLATKKHKMHKSQQKNDQKSALFGRLPFRRGILAQNSPDGGNHLPPKPQALGGQLHSLVGW